jgi:diacylglycerol kinase (ATP)
LNKPTIIFIINPHAGKGKQLSKKRILSLWHDHEVHFLERYEGRDERVKSYLSQGVKDFVVAGGDGTVNDLGRLLMHTDARLGIVPLGSGNGLARDLGLPMEKEHALQVIRKGKTRRIDVGLLNDRPFFCTAGLGFDALCAYDFAHTQHSRGLWNYIKIIFQNYFTYRGSYARMGGEEVKYFSLTFANAGQFGNEAYIAPHARLDDGFLDCALILPHPKYRFAELGFHLMKKSLDRFPYFKTHTFKSMALENTGKLFVHIDGESVNLSDHRIEVKVAEKALNVFSI